MSIPYTAPYSIFCLIHGNIFQGLRLNNVLIGVMVQIQGGGRGLLHTARPVAPRAGAANEAPIPFGW